MEVSNPKVSLVYCENCGNKVDDDAVFCSRCGNQMVPQKAHDGTRKYVTPKKKETDDFLCFGEESEDGWVGGLIMILIGIFLASVFLDFQFPIEIILPGAFILIGVGIIIKSRQKERR